MEEINYHNIYTSLIEQYKNEKESRYKLREDMVKKLYSRVLDDYNRVNNPFKYNLDKTKKDRLEKINKLFNEKNN